jgi:hypothetical protein
MNIELAQALITRGVINDGTRILAKCPVSAFGGVPTEREIFLTVNKIISDEGTLKFISSHRTGRKFSVPLDKIIEVDGMEPTRLGLAYDIKDNGSKKSAGKKRGRKPRINTAGV